VVARRVLGFTLAVLAVQLTLSLVLSRQMMINDTQERPHLLLALAVLQLGEICGTALLAIHMARRHVVAMRQLHVREQQAAADARNTSEWLWECDLNGVLTYCNQGVQSLLGYTAHEVVGRSTFDLLADEASRSVLKRYLIGRVAATGRAEDIEVQWRHRNGEVLTLCGSTAVIHNSQGCPIGVRGSRGSRADGIDARRLAAEATERVSGALASTEVARIALQPIVALTGGHLVGAEALARFSDDRQPDEWFRDAASAGLLQELDRHLFEKATKMFPALPQSCYLSINAGPDLLLDADFTEQLLASSLPLDRLVIEITEHARVYDYGALVNATVPLRRRGIRLAVDDTGAGYASFNHVLQLRPDIIKLDRSLIIDLDADAARRSLITALVLLGLDLGASITSEGVETAVQYDTLLSLGVDNAQGYLLSRPTTDPTAWTRWSDYRW